MDKKSVAKQTLQEQLKFAQRASVLVKTPQYNELQKMMMEEFFVKTVHQQQERLDII